MRRNVWWLVAIGALIVADDSLLYVSGYMATAGQHSHYSSGNRNASRLIFESGITKCNAISNGLGSPVLLDSAVGSVHRAPGNFPSGQKGDVLTGEFTLMGIPCLGSS